MRADYTSLLLLAAADVPHRFSCDTPQCALLVFTVTDSSSCRCRPKYCFSPLTPIWNEHALTVK